MACWSEADETFSDTVTLQHVGANNMIIGGNPSVSVGPRGHAIVTWEYVEASRALVAALLYDPATNRWEPPLVIGGSGGGSRARHTTVVDAYGNVTVLAWTGTDPFGACLRHVPGLGWGNPTRLEGAEFKLAVDPFGRVHALAWREKATSSVLVATRFE